MNELRYIRNTQLAVIIGSSLVIVLLVIVWIISGPGQEWKGVQKGYAELIEQLSDSLPEISMGGVDKGIQEYQLDDLNRTDRCITCHMGVENPYTADANHPYKAHPGEFLADHLVEKYGCTICHGGQGKALNKEDAFGREASTHWTEPLLTDPYMESSCGKCHLSIYGEKSVLAGTEVFMAGKEIFSREGCLGCHKARGLGGIVGPDLTEQGEKTKHDYNFQNISGEQTVSHWLKEHFRDPEMVSPGSQMLKIDLQEEELEALTTFVLGLAKPDISYDYLLMEALNEFKGERMTQSGDQIFSLACAGCHAKDGSGKNYLDYATGVPAIMNKDFQRVASEDFISFTLNTGRSTRQMASWESSYSGMKEDEMNALVSFVDGKESQANYVFDRVKLRNADHREGENLFKNYCATCHGEEGEGGLALALNRRDMLNVASNEYLYATLVHGRGNTAMPSWNMFADEEIHSIVKYLRTWGNYSISFSRVNFGDSDPENGSLRYHFLCSRCHGESGQGQTGPAIINKDFMEVASDNFLYQTIASGRGHTAMFGWSKDVYNAERLEKDEIGDIVSFLRAESLKRPDYIYAGSNPGDTEKGKLFFEKHCAECHGVHGEGSKAPALNNQEFLNAASNGYMLGTVTIGREGTRMPRWGMAGEEHPMLSGKERQDIIAFIRSWQRIGIKTSK